MTTINSLGNGLSGVTGTGNVVGSNTPTLVTPVLGAATGTSLSLQNFGTPLTAYTAFTAWTPAFTFGTVGDLSVSYGFQTGYYTRIGDICTVLFAMNFIPTFTTSSGNAFITGLPIASKNTIGNHSYGSLGFVSGIIYPAGATYLSCSVDYSSTQIQLFGMGSGQSAVNITTTGFVSTLTYVLAGSLTYILGSS